MSRIIFFMQKIVEIYKQVFSVLKKTPTILFLFVLLGIFDGIALIVLFFAPIPPVADFFAPIIRTFWGDRYLHYPLNFLLLPKLFSHAHFLISTVLGVFVTGIVIKKIEAETLGQRLSTLSAVFVVSKKYFSLVIVWLFSYGVFALSLKEVLSLLPRNLGVQLLSGFILGLVIQSIFAFLFPALLIIKSSFFKTLLEGIRLGLRNIVLTSALIFVPMLFALIISVSRLFTPFFVGIYPELVLWVLAVGIVISLLVDILVTSSVTLLLLKVRDQNK